MLRTGVLSLCLLALLSTASVSAAALGSRELDAVPLHVLPLADLERARAALPVQAPNGPVRFAIPVPFPLGLSDGAWTDEGDTAVWRTRLNSGGARLLIAHFDRFDLPPDAVLTISDVAGTVIQGPYTAANRAPDGELWTALVPGEEALLELRVPQSQRGGVDLHIAELGHGVTSLRADEVQAKSGSCNVDVACEADAGWRDQARAVVLLQIGGDACTGNLVNTTTQDDRPYVLTATHCGVTSVNASTIIAYFNYQTSTCGGAANGSLSKTVTGATLLFQHVRSDHTLIRLNSAPPLSYGAYFAGFDASSTAIPQSGKGIHHPNADEKRISTYSTPAIKTPVNLAGASTVDAFAVFWSAGVTEPGSSGSGLWNENKRVVGVLSGGGATCGSLLTPASNGPDYYGRLHVAWSAGLDTYLNPSGNGSTTVAGKNQTSTTGGGSTGGGGVVTGGGSSSGGGGGGGGGGGAFGGGLALLLVGLARRVKRRPLA